jgi:hypothetical protein
LASIQAGRHASSYEGSMNPQEYEIARLRHDLAAAETEIRELRKKVIDQILEYTKLEGIAMQDLIRIMKEMR